VLGTREIIIDKEGKNQADLYNQALFLIISPHRHKDRKRAGHG
jgi:hypothetical protein